MNTQSCGPGFTSCCSSTPYCRSSNALGGLTCWTSCAPIGVHVLRDSDCCSGIKNDANDTCLP
ncbi:MAG: hypothetical protein GQE15_11025 [Archangiaceae bacterium]|nr:hypothetical protein [Archangiaceae bacterium]